MVLPKFWPGKIFKKTCPYLTFKSSNLKMRLLLLYNFEYIFFVITFEKCVRAFFKESNSF